MFIGSVLARMKSASSLGIFFDVHGKDELSGVTHALSHVPAFYHSRELFRAA
jgi:hypothetical protein